MKRVPRVRFDFDEMRIGATSADRSVRKRAFTLYFEQFEEFPTYVFDNDPVIDKRLQETINDLSTDPETSESMKKGIVRLKERLPLK